MARPSLDEDPEADSRPSPAPIPPTEEERRIRVILGLGNPGDRYARTRHNAGFLVLDQLRAAAGATWRRQANREEAEATLEGVAVLLVRPRTWMNRSGEAVGGLLRERDLRPSEMLVVVDDAALPPGRLRLRARGSAGGHNGLLSLCEHLESEDFPRLRVGVGAPDPQIDLAEYVLEPLDGGDWADFRRDLERAADAVRWALRYGILAAMNRINPAGQSERGDAGGPNTGGDPAGRPG